MNAAGVIHFLIRSLLFIEILANIDQMCVFPASISGSLYSMISGKLVTYILAKNWQLNWQEFRQRVDNIGSLDTADIVINLAIFI